MIEKKEKTKVRLVVPLNGTIGLYKGRALYELSGGLGVSFNKENDSSSNLIYGFLATLWQYDRALDGMRSSGLLGLAWKTKRAGTFHIAFPVDDRSSSEVPTLTDDIKVRIGATVHARNSLAVSTNFYYRSFDDFIPSLSFGFSF